MSVQIDTFNSSIVTAVGSTVSLVLAVANNPNRALVALIGVEGSLTVSSVAYTVGSGGAWVKLGAMTTASGRYQEIWSSVNPDVSANDTVLVTFSGPLTGDGGLLLYSLYNVLQSNPVDTYTSEPTANALSLTVNTTTGNLALCNILKLLGSALSGCSTTIDMGVAGGNLQWFSAHCTGNPNVTFTWSTPGDSAFGLQGCNVNAVPTGPQLSAGGAQPTVLSRPWY